MKLTRKQTALRYNWYVQLAVDAAALLVFALSWHRGVVLFPWVAALLLVSLGNVFACGRSLLGTPKRMLPNEEYQRLAARYFPYGNRWLWTMLQYKQMKGMAGENGRAVLRLWLGVIGVCAGSMLAIYLASYLLTIVL